MTGDYRVEPRIWTLRLATIHRCLSVVFEESGSEADQRPSSVRWIRDSHRSHKAENPPSLRRAREASNGWWTPNRQRMLIPLK